MILTGNEKRALKAVVLDGLKESTRMLIFIPVVLLLFAALLVAQAVHAAANFTQSTGSIGFSSNVLSFGFIIATFALAVSAFLSISYANFRQQMNWPVNRKVIALGNYIISSICAFVLLASTSAVFFLELLACQVIKNLSLNVNIINEVTLENFLAGFWASFSYTMLIVSMSYCVSMFFQKYSKQTVFVLIAVFVLYVTLANVRNIIDNAVHFFTREAFLFDFSIKAWLFIFIFLTVGFIPLKRLEATR